ncbi:hypothetical protein SAMN05443245_4614 [Paraburkholderia fungorum]|uniref:Uncharacterized protein n=1 Tax=Paraburkholderia fungorum TaxID=134537 RepID=A0A1H1I4F6_9BURK|nr:HAD domain-containing protein [Paraburkholderia fungorum]SDR32248.1 hypothetical protein SAMN05443245_4614 [Paraburkholderia fungorum]
MPHSPLAQDRRVLGDLVRESRQRCQLNLLDAADYLYVDITDLSHVEDGLPVSTETLFKVLAGYGLEMLVMNRNDASDALHAVGHSVNWYEVMERRSPSKPRTPPAPLLLDNLAPTLFVDFDGTLHVGNAYIDDAEEITLDTGRQLLEFAPLLSELLAPFPDVQIVLTTSWARRLPEDRVIGYLPLELRARVIGTTGSIKPRRSYVLDGTERTDVITSYAYGKRLKHWLALDDSVFGVERFGREPGELVDNFLLLKSSVGISDGAILTRIAKWLADVHASPDN